MSSSLCGICGSLCSVSSCLSGSSVVLGLVSGVLSCSYSSLQVINIVTQFQHLLNQRGQHFILQFLKVIGQGSNQGSVGISGSLCGNSCSLCISSVSDSLVYLLA